MSSVTHLFCIYYKVADETVHYIENITWYTKFIQYWNI